MTTIFTLAGEPYELIPTSKWTFGEARAFEKETGFTFLDLRLSAQVQKSAATEQAMLWISMRRVKPETRFTDLDSLAPGDVEYEADDEDDEAEADGDGEESADPTEGEDSPPSD